jgi:aryl-alcohol dehydrogenase-like predicted oxidoreductase
MSAYRESLAKLGVGTAALGLPYGIGGERIARDAAVALLRKAVAAGIRYVDTAAAYGDAEAVVGMLAPELRDADVRVCTKITAPLYRTHGALAALRDSLARLRAERVDTVLLHSADAATLRDPLLGAGLAEIITAGLAARIGVSTYGAADALLAHALPWVGTLQVEHSILNPSVMSALGARNSRVEIVARSVLCKGLLTARRLQAGAVLDNVADALDRLEAFARVRGFDLPGLAIRFALDSPAVDRVLLGVSNEAELEVALRAAAHVPLTPAELDELAAFDRSHDDASHPELWPAPNARGAAS